MANENPSRDSSSRQQSSERAQAGSMASQQGSGTGTSSQRSGSQGSNAYGPGSSVQGSPGTSTWQGGRAGQTGGTLQRRGPPSMSPYGADYESGYGAGPFSIMRRISDEMDRFFENFGMGRGLWPSQEPGPGESRYGTASAPSMWSPHIDVRERNGKLVIEADLPGLKRDDINVRIERDSIIIQGERNQEQTSNQSGYYRSERSYGSFYRAIPLPEGTNTDSATASFKDGVLEIELDAPREQQRGRTLEIGDGGAAAGGSRT